MPVEVVQTCRFEVSDLPSETVIFGGTAAMRGVRDQIERILHNDLPVLIRGESGTGKEVIAKFLHSRSDRGHLPFVKLNCAAMQPGSLEIEFFRGGGPDSSHKADRGLVEAVAGGTLFLDEVGELSWECQAKLLDLLEDGQIRLAGGQRARVVCSTNRDLERAVEQRTFRRDLFYRIEVIGLQLVPLRERKQDIPQLCRHFVQKLAQKFGRVVPELSPQSMRLLLQWNWPGNLCELENSVARLVVLGDDKTLKLDVDRQREPRQQRNGASQVRPGSDRKRRRVTALPARGMMLRALKANRWNRRKAAEDLNMSYRAFLARMREAGVPRRGTASHGESGPKWDPEIG